MNSELKKADLKCPKCNAELLVIDEMVICQICEKQIKPRR